jgi:hypothetical protein
MDFIHRLMSQDKKKQNKNYRQKKTDLKKETEPVLLSLVCFMSVCLCVCFQICCSVVVFWSFCDCDLCVGVSFFATCVFWLQVFLYASVQVCWSVVLIWFLCDLYVEVLLIDLFRFLVFLSKFLFFDLETPDDE